MTLYVCSVKLDNLLKETYALIAQRDVWNVVAWMSAPSAKRMHILMLENSASVTTVISWI